MGKKRRMTHSGKFKNKLSSHPRTKIIKTSSSSVNESLNVLVESPADSVEISLASPVFEAVEVPKTQEPFPQLVVAAQPEPVAVQPEPEPVAVQPEPVVKKQTRATAKKSNTRKKPYSSRTKKRRAASRSRTSSSERVSQSKNN
jgi:hypothetical protein